MNVLKHTGFFHDGEILNIQQKGNAIELSIESSVTQV